MVHKTVLFFQPTAVCTTNMVHVRYVSITPLTNVLGNE